MENNIPVRDLKFLSTACIILVAFAIAVIVDEFLYPDHGRMAFFSSFMSLVIAYSCLDMLNEPLIALFVIIYVSIHIVLVFLSPIPDTSYYGAILIPAAILDYMVSVYAVYFLYGRRHE